LAAAPAFLALVGLAIDARLLHVLTAW
jgi:hypothetical protein